MPNWTFNTVTVKTEDKELRENILSKFTNTNDKGELVVTYTHLIPMPKEIENTTSGGSVSIGNWLLFGDSQIFGLFGAHPDKENIEEIYNQHRSSPIEYRPEVNQNPWVKQTSFLTDVYFINHPDKKEVTYGELVDWIESIESEDTLEKNHISSAKAALAEARLQAENAKKYGAPSWYEWACMNWGVKWDACHSDVLITDSEIVFSFDSPWGCPDPVMGALSREFPEVTFLQVSEFEMEPLVFHATWIGGEIVDSYDTSVKFQDAMDISYESDELQNHDEYFGEWWYNTDMSTDFWSPFGKTKLNVICEYITTDEGDKFRVRYKFINLGSSHKPFEYGELEGNEYPSDKRPLDIIVEDLVASKSKLEDKFGHLHGWWFNKPKPVATN